jgi:hypothetical protein
LIDLAAVACTSRSLLYQPLMMNAGTPRPLPLTKPSERLMDTNRTPAPCAVTTSHFQRRTFSVGVHRLQLAERA